MKITTHVLSALILCVSGFVGACALPVDESEAESETIGTSEDALNLGYLPHHQFKGYVLSQFSTGTGLCTLWLVIKHGNYGGGYAHAYWTQDGNGCAGYVPATRLLTVQVTNGALQTNSQTEWAPPNKIVQALIPGNILGSNVQVQQYPNYNHSALP